jgi:hypothetical protein
MIYVNIRPAPTILAVSALVSSFSIVSSGIPEVARAYEMIPMTTIRPIAINIFMEFLGLRIICTIGKIMVITAVKITRK